MDLIRTKFYLGKYGRMENIEGYSLSNIREYWEIYKKYLKDNKGVDIDHPDFKLNMGSI